MLLLINEKQQLLVDFLAIPKPRSEVHEFVVANEITQEDINPLFKNDICGHTLGRYAEVLYFRIDRP